MRAFCTGNAAGKIENYMVNTYNASAPGPSLPPTTNNSTIKNNTPFNFTFNVKRNYTPVAVNFVNAGGEKYFYIADGVGLTVVVLIPVGVRPSSATLESDGVTYTGVITDDPSTVGNLTTFSGVDLVSGCIININ